MMTQIGGGGGGGEGADRKGKYCLSKMIEQNSAISNL